jgi:hypothetical protein
MIILQQTIEDQTFKCIPRSYKTGVILILENETTNARTNIVPSIEIIDDNYFVTAEFDLKNDSFYNITILYGEEVIFKDRVFCTDQVVYDINKNVYTSDTTYNNDYITI